MVTVDEIQPPTCEGGSCELFGIFGISVQCFIGFWCVFTLFILWRCETPRRDLCTWIADMAKQMLGAGWAHFFNVFAAIIFGKALETGEIGAYNNQCVWYLVGFLSDILLVTLICWFVVSTLRPHIREQCGIDIGEYDTGHGGEEDFDILEDDGATTASGMSFWMMWCAQVAIWIAILSVVKGLVFYAAYIFQDQIYTSIATCFRWLSLCGHDRRQLVTSVIIIPVIGDFFQFVVQDGFLKRRTDQDTSDESSSDGECGKIASRELHKLPNEFDDLGKPM